MADLILYITFAFVGYLISSRFVKDSGRLTFTGPLQTASIACLVIFMGGRMGANDEVIKNLKGIGAYAFIMTLIIILFSVGAVSFARRCMKLDSRGHAPGSEKKDGENAAEGPQKSGLMMTLFIVITVAVGMVSGYLAVHRGFLSYDRFDSTAGKIIKVVLCILLFLVGMDLGKKNTFVEDIKSVGLKALFIPAAVCAGTLAAGALCSLFLPVSLKESLAIASGFGWYSLAPGIIMEKGLVMASAISFMHNIFREFTSIIFMPLVAKKIGFIEVTGMPGAGAGDICLPFIIKSTRSGMVLYAFITGMTLSILVPVLVPLFVR